MSVNTKKDELIGILGAVIDAFNSVNGQQTEIVLHDLECPEASVLKIVNGHVSGRKVGSPLHEGPENDIGFLGLLGHEHATENLLPAVFTDYPTKSLQGRALRSSTVLFRDVTGKATLSLCFNADYRDLEFAREALARLMPADKAQTNTDGNGLEVKMNEIIRTCVPPSGQMRTGATKKEKVEIVRLMQEKGLFIVRGGVEKAAKVLGVTRYTVYNYLDEIKKGQQS